MSIEAQRARVLAVAAEIEHTRTALVANRERRAQAAAEVAAARDELRALLIDAGKRIGVAEMARIAGVSRDTAHRLLGPPDPPLAADWDAIRAQEKALRRP